MAKGRRKKSLTQAKSGEGNETTDFYSDLWAMADTLRGNMDAAEYKHVVLGLIFLKYISDAFEERHAEVLAEWGEDAAEDQDEYVAEKHLLGASRGPLAVSQEPGAPAHHREADRQRHDRHRARQPVT